MMAAGLVEGSWEPHLGVLIITMLHPVDFEDGPLVLIKVRENLGHCSSWGQPGSSFSWRDIQMS